MSPAIRVALIGFTPFEARHITGLLAHGDPARPVYRVCEDMAGSGVVICNADDEPAVAAVAREGRGAGCLMLGTKPRDGVAAQLAKPIRPLQLLRTLERISRATPAMNNDVRRVQDELARISTRPSPLSPLDPVARRPRLDHILVIDSHDAVLRFVTEQVQRFGFQVHLVRSGEEGLRRSSHRHFEFVFLAAGIGGIDPFQACKDLKAAARQRRARPPCVVLLLDVDNEADRLRAQMAGADACLAKPLDSAALLRVFGAREVASVAYADTAQTNNAAL